MSDSIWVLLIVWEDKLITTNKVSTQEQCQAILGRFKLLASSPVAELLPGRFGITDSLITQE